MRAKTKDALARITELEEMIPAISNAVNKSLQQVDQHLGNFNDTLEAVTALLGVEQVSAKKAELLAARVVQQVENQKNAVAEAVKGGSLLVTGAVTEKSLVIGVETDKDGNVAGSGRVQLPMQGIKPEFQAQLLGKSVGASFDLPTGGKFTCTEIYVVVEDLAEPTVEPEFSEPKLDLVEGCSPTDCAGCGGNCASSTEKA
jgi:hypothetical protein